MCSEKRYRTYRDYIQQYLEDYLKRFEAEPQKQIFEAMKYSLLAGGKHGHDNILLPWELCRGSQGKCICQQGIPRQNCHGFAINLVIGQTPTAVVVIVHARQIVMNLLDIQSRKTGALIRAACVLGVIAGGGTDKQLQAAAVFADRLGLAFQIRDDMLDVIGSAGELGKATGVDGDKNTFVRLYGLEKCEDLVHKYTSEAICQLSQFENPQDLISLAESLTTRRV